MRASCLNLFMYAVLLPLNQIISAFARFVQFFLFFVHFLRSFSVPFRATYLYLIFVIFFFLLLSFDMVHGAYGPNQMLFLWQHRMEFRILNSWPETVKLYFVWFPIQIRNCGIVIACLALCNSHIIMFDFVLVYCLFCYWISFDLFISLRQCMQTNLNLIW